jgi:hypothetical protein
MKRSIYIKIVNNELPGCEVNMGLEGDCSKAHRDDALKFVEAICSILGWDMNTVATETTYTEGDIEE